MFPSHRNKSTDLQSKSIDWFLYGENIVRKWVNNHDHTLPYIIQHFNPLSANPTQLVKYTQTIRRQQPTNCLSVFDHFEGLGLKGLIVNTFSRGNRDSESTLCTFFYPKATSNQN